MSDHAPLVVTNHGRIECDNCHYFIRTVRRGKGSVFFPAWCPHCGHPTPRGS